MRSRGRGDVSGDVDGFSDGGGQVERERMVDALTRRRRGDAYGGLTCGGVRARGVRIPSASTLLSDTRYSEGGDMGGGTGRAGAACHGVV